MKVVDFCWKHLLFYLLINFSLNVIYWYTYIFLFITKHLFYDYIAYKNITRIWQNTHTSDFMYHYM